MRRVLAIVLVLAGCVGPAEPQAPEAFPPEEDEVIPLPVRGDQMRRDEAGTLHVLGEVSNPTASPVIFVLVRVALMDERGGVVGQQTIPALRAIVPPGELAPFDVVFPRVADAHTYSIEASAELFDSAPAPEPMVLDVRRIDAPAGSYVTGTVMNGHDRAAENVRIVATFYDDAGKVVAAASIPSEPGRLEAGGTGTFETTPQPSRFGAWNLTTRAGYR